MHTGQYVPVSRVTNVMIQADLADSDTVRTLSEWLRKEAPNTGYGNPRIRPSQWCGVGSLGELTKPGANHWGGWKEPECDVWGGALNHADVDAVLERIASLPWRYPYRVQVFVMDQEEPYFRVYMYRDGTWNQYAPPPVPDDEDDW